MSTKAPSENAQQPQPQAGLTDQELDEISGGNVDNRPTEEVAFYYNKIAFSYGSQITDK